VNIDSQSSSTDVTRINGVDAVGGDANSICLVGVSNNVGATRTNGIVILNSDNKSSMTGYADSPLDFIEFTTPGLTELSTLSISTYIMTWESMSFTVSDLGSTAGDAGIPVVSANY
jgi:hypothetical protein